MSTLQNGLQRSQQSLPPDCLALVVDCIDDPGTLFSFLTVSKTAFSVAAKRLYRSMSIVNKHRRRVVYAYVRLVLSLSTLQDTITRALRDEFEVCFPRKQVYTDYLALIRDIAFHPDDDAGCWRTDHFPRRNSSVYRGMDLRPLVAWAICAHSRMANMTGLTIECDNLARYKGYIPCLAALQRIIFDIGSSEQVAHVHEFMQLYIQTHGPRARRISLELAGAFREDFGTVLTIYALLDPPNPHPREITKATFAPYVLYQDTTDFSNVLAIDGFYDDLGHTRAILPRCPRLESLSAKLSPHGPSLFGWIKPSCTGDRATPSSSIPTPTTGLSLPPTPTPPPVKHIELYGSPASAFHALCDALSCFGSTLETIRLQDPDDTNEQPQVYRLASRLCLPRLRELRIVFELNEYSVSFQPNSLPKMPAIEVLEMYHSFDRYVDIGGRQYNEEFHERYPLTTWDVFSYMPMLKVLHLSGRTAAEFHPGSLQFMPYLESLTVRIRSSDWSRYWPRALWTWDWELPFLKELHLGGAMASAFVFRALQYMPSLEHLRLECKPPAPMPVPDYETLLMTGDSQDTTARRVPDSVLGRPFGRKVKHVFLGGRLRFTTRDWEQLLEHWFPNLEVLDLDLLITRRTKTIFGKARRHRRLRLLTLNTSDDELDDEDASMDGELDTNSSNDSESYNGDTEGGDLMDEGCEPLHDYEEDAAGEGRAKQDEFFVCRIDDMLYRVKKICDTRTPE
ncbi:hypothetical protein BGW42_003323 [Actinomortierella wolfii]|nr:hypothetical protein BGW42_003323 [Actinomortierella wolfii]